MTASWDFVSYRSKRYLENLLALGLIVVMALIFFVHVNRLAIAAERASVQQMLSILRQGVQVFMFSKVIKNDREGFASYDDGNPFAMLSQLPEHYVGEYSAEDGAQLPAGRWYFELDSRQAVYRFANRPWREEAGGREIRLSLQYVPAKGEPLPLKLREVQADNSIAKSASKN